MNNRISELRKKYGYSQEDLGNKIGCTQQAISTIEQGKREIPYDLCYKIADIFGVNTDYLFYNADYPNSLKNSVELKVYSDRIKKIITCVESMDPEVQEKLENFLNATIKKK